MPTSNNSSKSSLDSDLTHDAAPPTAEAAAESIPVPNPPVVPSATFDSSGRHLPAPTFSTRPTQSTPSFASRSRRGSATAQSVGYLHPSIGGDPETGSAARISSIDGHPGESTRASAVLIHPPSDGETGSTTRLRSPSFGKPRPLANVVSGVLAASAPPSEGLPALARGGTKSPTICKASTGRTKQTLRSVLPTNLWEDALFSLAYVTVRDNELPPMLSWILKAVEDLQLLSFALTQRLHHDAPTEALVIVEPIRLIHDYHDFQIVNAIALALILLTAVLALFVVSKVARSSKVPIPALRVLRLLFTVEMSALSIPIAQLLLAGLDCGSGHVAHYDQQCFGSEHLPLFIMNVIGISVFAPLLLVASLVFLETSPTSLSPEAKPHGRIDFIIVAARLGFVALYTFMPETSNGNWFYSVLITLGLLYLIRSVTLAQPYYDPRMTAMRLGFMVASACAMIASMVAYGTGAAQGWLTMFVPAAVVGFVAGVVLAQWSARWIFSQNVRKWHRISKLEQQAAGGAHVEASAAGLLEGRTKSGRRFQAASISHLGMPPPSTMGRGTVPHSPSSPRTAMDSTVAGWVSAVADTNALTRLMEKTSTEVLNEVQAKKMVMRDRVFSSPLQVEACIRFIRENPTPNQITVGLQLLERGLIEFDDTLLLFIAATYLAAYFGDTGKTAADELIEQIKARPIRFDEKFLVYAKERQEREDDKLGEYGAQGRGLLESAEFQNLDRKSKKEHLLSLYAMRELFDTVRAQGSLVQLSNALDKLTLHRTVATDTYARLLIKFPKSKSVLRSYAQFLIAVDGDQIKAAQLLALVDEVDRDEQAVEPDTSYPPPLTRGGSVFSDGVDPACASDRNSLDLRPDDVPQANRSAIRPRPGFERISPPPPPLTPNADAVSASRATFHVSTKPSLNGLDKPRGRGGVSPNANGSQTSGTSMSREQRQHLESRRHLVARVTRPLNQLPVIGLIGSVYLAALVAGFVVCVTFFAQSRSVMQVDFTLAKVSRRQTFNIIDSIQRMLAANFYRQWPAYTSMMRTEFAAAYTALQQAWAQVTSEAIPFLGKDSGSGSTLYRVSSVVNTTIPDVVDYEPASLSLLELVQSIAIAGGVALQFPTIGDLTFARVQGIPAIGYIYSNFWTLLNAVCLLPQKGIEAYDVLTASSNVQLIVTLVVAILALLVLGVFLYVKPLNGYFGVETITLTLIADIHKRAATELVTTTEEEIEAFIELTNLDDETDLDVANQARMSPAGATIGENHQRGDKQRVTRLILVAMIAVGTLTASMFAVAFQTQNVTVLMKLMTQSIERRFYLRVNQMLTRQFLVPDETLISNSENLRTLRSNLYDFKQMHAKLTSDPNGLAALFPQYTVYQSNPAAVTTSALAGNTAFTATVALDPGMSAYIEDATRFVTTMNPVSTLIGNGQPGTHAVATAIGNLTLTLPGPDAPEWIFLLAQNDLLNVQLDALDAAIGDRVLSSVNLALTGCIVVFTATVAAAVAFAVHIHVVVFCRLRDKARALVAVLFLMPPSVTKDAPELANLIKSGGLSLKEEDAKDS
ncbi:hypothetical protein AMAG_15849 [Allomyces macrogynus ATCC 38327]|uniref:TmcB/TmcC TPR repeats domain-containing protein n=1 Tax=Allomyces macrogynus (strain ATCC 38327) TaxID=578462 RepID=A0A0L0T8Q3_ALLM3|nr:hypothetical protein AMAG_15849 [Allomyces macrogynus ATCC 38327]|eukprot:KNE71188.1 hypothetical protein AMAG_15849 [Allomyces macrogynus ATCC 38327]